MSQKQEMRGGDVGGVGGVPSDELLAAFAARVVQRARPYAVQVADGTYRWRHEEVTLGLLLAHLRGEETLALSSSDTLGQTCWLCLDVDDAAPDALAHLLAARRALGALGLPGLVEASRRGGHLWLFLDEPLAVENARAALLTALAWIQAHGVTMPGYELYPDRHAQTPRALGHAVRLPLGVHQLTGKRYPLFDEDGHPCALTSDAAALKYLCAWPGISSSVIHTVASLAVQRTDHTENGDEGNEGNEGDNRNERKELVSSHGAYAGERMSHAVQGEMLGEMLANQMGTVSTVSKIGTRSAVIRWVDAHVSPLDLLAELAADSAMHRAGQGYLGWCPFHDDRASDELGRPGTKSFYVVRDRHYGWSWRCLSRNCSQHTGPMRHSFRLFQELTGLTVASAVVEALAWWPDAKDTGEMGEMGQIDASNADERSRADAAQNSAD